MKCLLTDTHLPSCVPQCQTVGLAVHRHVGAVVVKHRGDVLGREGVRSVGDQETGLTHAPVTQDKKLNVLHGAYTYQSDNYKKYTYKKYRWYSMALHLYNLPIKC